MPENLIAAMGSGALIASGFLVLKGISPGLGLVVAGTFLGLTHIIAASRGGR